MGLGGRIISLTTASVFPIVVFFFSPCIAGFIGSIRRHDPSLTKPSPSLISLHRYNLPVGKRGGSCAIEIAVDDGTARRLQEYVSHPASAVMQPARNQLDALSGKCVKLASQSTVCATSPLDKRWCDSEGLTFVFGLCDLGNHRINNQRNPGSRGSVNSLPLISEHIQGLFFCLHTDLINLKRKLLRVKVVALKALMWLASFDGNKWVGWENVTWCEIISRWT